MSIATSFVEARAGFLDAATTAGARVESWAHPLAGLQGEALSLDVAELGPPDSSDVIVVVSGTHGVEGYLGSALQRQHLETLDQAGVPDVALVFVHALNPFGFSWMRRVNEDNVDLNRNFIDWNQPPPANDGYLELADALVPDSWTAEAQERSWSEVRTALRALGPDQAQQVVSGGQFQVPAGLFTAGLARHGHICGFENFSAVGSMASSGRPSWTYTPDWDRGAMAS